MRRGPGDDAIQFCCIAASGSGFPGAVVGVVVVVMIALLAGTALTTLIIVLALKLRRYVSIGYEVSTCFICLGTQNRGNVNHRRECCNQLVS